jgi:ubiquitin carboxyl-terminal hydrolase 34
MAIRAFWRICSDNDINPDVVEKASTRLIQLVKFGEAITEDKKILEEAIINVKEGRGVLQSLKVIKELVSLGDAKANTKALCEGGIMEAVFTNIKDLKASIKEKAEKAGLDFKSLNEQTLATLIPKGTTFEEQILKRLRFIDFLLHQLHPPKEQMLGIIARIWDELVANPVVPQEPSLFKKWFVKFSGKEGEEFVDSEVLQEFFFDKIKMLYDGKPEASELLKTFLEIFYRINLLNKNIRETTLYYEGSVSSVMSDSSKQIVYEIESSPEFLAGIQALWELIEHTKDENISNELIEYITKLYVRQEGDKSGTGFKKYQGFMESFVNRIAYLYDKYTKEENWSTNPDSIRVLKRLLGLLMESVDLTESIYPVKPCSIDTLYRGEKVNLTIDNNIQVTYQSPKKIDLRVYANITLIEIKQKIAAELGRITWRNVSISRPSKKGDIKDKHNSRTLRDMRVRLGERLQSDNRPILIKTKEPLVANDQLTPRADQAFREVFRRYAKDGKMGPVETAKFGQCVLENNTIGPTDIKILDLIEKWDKDKDGSLSEEEFFEFYRSSSMNKASVVWQNLKSLGYGDDLLLLSAEEEWNEADLARFHIMKNTGLIQGLFKLVDRRDEIGQAAWDFFSRMPPIESEVQKITKLQSGWDDLKSGSVYKSMYTLYILDFLLEEDDKDAPDQTETSIGHVEGGIKQFRKKWREDFVKAGGFVTLLSILAQLVQKGVSSRLDMVLFSFILKSVSNYILAGATMNNTELYRDVAFIASGLPLSAFKQGKKQTQAKKDTPAKESLKNIIQKYAVDFNKANPLNPASVEMSAAQNQSNMQVESSQSPSAAVQTDTEPKAIGPENKTVFIGPSNDPEKDKENKEKNEKEKEVLSLTSKLNESEDFKQFRESLRQIGDTPLTRLDSIETLRFIAKLIQETLNKSSSVDLEEINIVKLSLSVFFCLLLSEPELLRKAIMTDEVKLLPEDSSFKIKGYSDLVSFLISGLLARRNFLFARYFSNAFSVIMLECGSKEVQTILVGAVHSQVMREDLPPKSQARYIELSCQIVDSICATGDDKDPKILLEKGDLNKIANLEEFFFRIIETVLDSKPIEVAPGETDYQNDLMISNFKILEKVLSVEPELKVKVGNKKSNDKSYIERIFNECLFNLKDDSSDSIEDSIKCKSTVTREACYDFLAELCSGNVQNSSELLTKGLDALCASIPTVKGWKYTPGRERKSPQGFLGINNLHNICYINAMIQQFYMTPVFRYGVLAAGEGEVKPPVLDKEGRPIDDHLLRQLQKLFAFLDKSERASYSPYEFCFSLKDPAGQPINVSIQQDTQEFLNIFFDKMENLLKPTPFKSLLSDVYGGKLIDMLGCTSCGHLRTTDQVFYNLSLEVKNFKNVKESLDKLTTQDIISDYKCEHCQQKCDVTKRPLVKECPNVLLVYLSRIIFDLDVLMNVKINTRYEFPFEFSLKDYTYDNFLREQEAEKKKNNPQANASQPQAKEQPNPNKLDGSAQPEGEANSELPPLQDADYQYTLAGVLVHRGSAEAGHYYSYINVNRLDPRRPRK